MTQFQYRLNIEVADKGVGFAIKEAFNRYQRKLANSDAEFLLQARLLDKSSSNAELQVKVVDQNIRRIEDIFEKIMINTFQSDLNAARLTSIEPDYPQNSSGSSPPSPDNEFQDDEVARQLAEFHNQKDELEKVIQERNRLEERMIRLENEYIRLLGRKESGNYYVASSPFEAAMSYLTSSRADLNPPHLVSEGERQYAQAIFVEGKEESFELYLEHCTSDDAQDIIDNLATITSSKQTIQKQRELAETIKKLEKQEKFIRKAREADIDIPEEVMPDPGSVLRDYQSKLNEYNDLEQQIAETCPLITRYEELYSNYEALSTKLENEVLHRDHKKCEAVVRYKQDAGQVQIFFPFSVVDAPENAIAEIKKDLCNYLDLGVKAGKVINGESKILGYEFEAGHASLLNLITELTTSIPIDIRLAGYSKIEPNIVIENQ